MGDVERAYAVVLTTVGTVDAGATLARELVSRGLVACVSIVGGVRSIYRWKDGIQEDAEAMLVMKTSADRFEALRSAIRELHTYETPEIVMIPVGGGDPAYLAWIDACVGEA